MKIPLFGDREDFVLCVDDKGSIKPVVITVVFWGGGSFIIVVSIHWHRRRLFGIFKYVLGFLFGYICKPVKSPLLVQIDIYQSSSSC